MTIGHYIKEIGRGKDGARALSRGDSTNLFGLLLDGVVSDLEVGAFCIAMRIKGETTDELCGFLDATQQRLTKIRISPTSKGLPPVVIPTYNGARKLPGLVPLLAMLLAREGFPVLLHGTPTEDRRVFTADVLSLLGVRTMDAADPLHGGAVGFVPTEHLHSGLKRLLDVRRSVGLRNPAHSLVKLMLPCEGPQILITSYTHPEYAESMENALCAMRSTALLLRGTEGEAVADARRMPKMCSIAGGKVLAFQEHQAGTLQHLPSLPTDCGATSTVAYIEAVLQGTYPVPAPIAAQVAMVCALAKGMGPGFASVV